MSDPSVAGTVGFVFMKTVASLSGPCMLSTQEAGFGNHSDDGIPTQVTAGSRRSTTSPKMLSYSSLMVECLRLRNLHIPIAGYRQYYIRTRRDRTMPFPLHLLSPLSSGLIRFFRRSAEEGRDETSTQLQKETIIEKTRDST
jgi:hypothetical protein